MLGVGGMGMVVSALHLQLEERVAIKFLLPEALANAETVARFGREARAAVKIRSEHVARVIDVGMLDNGAPYMVMELLRGQDLSAALRERGLLPAALAVAYVLQACEALAEAHALGIVHRDLKPANLFLTSRADGSACVKVLDFGISKVTSPGSSSGPDMGMTRTQTVMGSPLYMSPEQMASARDVDPRSDIWAIGTVLYELVTGRVPFEAETMPQLCTLILHREPPSPRSLRPELPAALDAAIMRCLRKERADRYPDVAALAFDLAVFAPDAGPRSAERISRVLGSSASVSSTELSAAPAAASAAVSNTGASQAWGTTNTARSSRAVWMGTLGLAALLLSAGVVAWKTLAVGASPERASAVQSTEASAAIAPAPSVLAAPAPPAASAPLGVSSAATAPEPPLSASSPVTVAPPPSKPAPPKAPVRRKTVAADDPLSERH